jgi:hypothetical protein
MSQLFDDLFALDRKIANRWKIRTHDNVRHVLTAADIDFIFVDLIRSARNTDITENQGSAIVMLLNASMAANSARSSAALRRIIHYVNIWQRAIRLNLQPLVGEEKLQPIADFFRNGAVSRIMFKSPGTNISYAPFDYVAVGQLILNRDVQVFISKTGGLSTLSSVSGAYFHARNCLMLYGMNPRDRRRDLVHEGTHVIQDWEDVTSLAHHNESDAFIAQAIAELTLEPDATDDEDGDVSKKAFAAARMVINKTATDSNAAWQRAYTDVVSAVGNRYRKYGMRENMIEDEEGTSERTRYQELLQKITTVNAVGNVVNGILDKAGATLSRVLP